MRYFTLQEANAFIPALQTTFGNIEKLRQRAVRLFRELAELGDRPNVEAMVINEDLPESVKVRRRQILETFSEIRRTVQELETHGLIVKELDGLVDFRSLRGKRPVFLSWRRGEDQVHKWHETWSDGEDGGQPVDKFFPKPLLN